VRLAHHDLHAPVHAGGLQRLLDGWQEQLVRRQHKLQLWSLVQHASRGLQEGLDQVTDFGRTAARQQRHHLRGRVERQCLACGGAVRLHGDHIGHRMPHKSAFDAMLGQQGGLEGVEAQDVAHALADLGHAFRTPGPDRRADQLDGRDAALLEFTLHGEVEVRRVYPHKQIRRLCDQLIDELAANARDVAVTHERFDQTPHRKLVAGPVGCEAQGLHLRAANAIGRQFRPCALQPPQQQGRELVARALGHRHGHTHAAQAPSPFRPAGPGGSRHRFHPLPRQRVQGRSAATGSAPPPTR